MSTKILLTAMAAAGLAFVGSSAQAATINIDYLIVGGGGGGGKARGGGGGGGGGLIYAEGVEITSGSVTVGAGGLGATSNTHPIFIFRSSDRPLGRPT